ncbi:MAG: hypothetical protein AB9917_02180 [Negativicutes bacterium]
MNFKDQMAADAAVFFNINEFGEAATYNGDPVTVVPEIGATLQPGTGLDSTGNSDRASFWVLKSEISAPKETDQIVHDGITWTAYKIGETDNVMHRVECSSRVVPHQWGR